LTIAADLIRGHTDTIILAQLQKGDSYGYKINKGVTERTGAKYEFKEATLYSAFRRLEENGCITSYWGDEQRGARRRYYKITGIGKETYNDLVKEWRAAREMIDKLIETEEE
jgi:DNA-binding PadR family transcriptional regulator